jgi:hypothetical protein
MYEQASEQLCVYGTCVDYGEFWWDIPATIWIEVAAKNQCYAWNEI